MELHLAPRMPQIVLSLLVIVASSAAAQQQPMLVAPSGRATAEVTLALADTVARKTAKPSKIRLDYGQPSLRGRKLLTDSLVPYDKAWRTGANESTTLTTDVDLVIGGQSVPKGAYVIQTLPGHAGWKLLIQKDVGQAPAEAATTYNPANDVARVDLRQTALRGPIESLTMWLIPSREPGKARGQLVIAWSNISLATDWSVK